MVQVGDDGADKSLEGSAWNEVVKGFLISLDFAESNGSRSHSGLLSVFHSTGSRSRFLDGLLGGALGWHLLGGLGFGSGFGLWHVVVVAG